MTDETSQKQKIDINIVELVSLASNIVHKMFIAAPKDSAKASFKKLKQGNAIALGNVNFKDLKSSDLKLKLDYSEFQGPGFNFDLFKLALSEILKKISGQFKQKGNLNLLTGDNNTVLLHLPGGVELKGQLNVMLMSLELGDLSAISINLLFVDPSQYDGIRSDTE